MRLAQFETDYWQLRSGEERHRQHPDTFEIPSLEQRSALRRGQSVRLIFDIEVEDEAGKVQVQGERMWVTVAARNGEYFIGILENQPASIEATEDVYLCLGAEVPFQAEHVIDIADPPIDFVEWQLGREPTRRWPRD